MEIAKVKIYHYNSAIFTISHDGRYIAYDDGNSILLYDNYEKTTSKIVDRTEGMNALAFNHSSTILAIGSYQFVQLYDIKTGILQKEIKFLDDIDESPIWDIKFSPNDKYIAFSNEETFRIWDLEKMQQIYYYESEEDSNGVTFQFFTDSKTLCIYHDFDLTIYNLDLISLEKTRSFSCPMDNYHTCSISPECNYIIIYGYNFDKRDPNDISHIYKNTGELVAKYTSQYILSGQFHPNERYIFCSTEAEDLQMWDLDTNQVRVIMKDKCYNLQVSPCGGYILYTNSNILYSMDISEYISKEVKSAIL